MNKQRKPALALSILTALTLAAPALAQTGTQTASPSMPAGEMKMAPSMPAGTMKDSGAMMKAVPMFRYSTMSGMNMMMTAGVMDIAPAPGERLISRSVKGTAATLVYSGQNSGSIFSFYDKALKGEGWKTTAMDGRKMAGDTMAGSTMAKPAGSTMNGAMTMGGTHSATFAMGGHTIDLNVRESGSRVTVTFKSQ